MNQKKQSDTQQLVKGVNIFNLCEGDVKSNPLYD